MTAAADADEDGGSGDRAAKSIELAAYTPAVLTEAAAVALAQILRAYADLHLDNSRDVTQSRSSPSEESAA